MSVHPRAGQSAQPADLVDVPALITAYYTGRPDPTDPAQQVSFGTSGHRGSSLNNAFNAEHILAVTQALCDYRRAHGVDGPLFLGRDTHALSAPATATALEVLAANDVTVLIDSRDGYTPTPAVSHAILTHNRGRERGLADGIVITPSHNPARRRWLQVQPRQRRPGRQRRDRMDPGPRQRPARRRAAATCGASRTPGRWPPPPPAGTTSSARTSTTCPPCSTWRRSATPGCASAPTRSAGRASPTGVRSPTGTGWT